MTEISEEIIVRRGTEVEALYSLAKTLNTGLDRRVLAILLELVELGVHPESLVDGETVIDQNFYVTFVNPPHFFLVNLAIEDIRPTK